ncbi:MAG: NifB/NifX family molybdenum-iron cluster-binding protein [Firmicutes bacterium]|nr:NifB/NifX family molybdenum-iron cluster-binding protein [Bacillota bacterium]
MKIAVASDGSAVSPHFGHCPEFAIVTVENGKAVDSTVLPNPGHRPDFLPQFLFEQGVSCIIAGGMGPRAQQHFAAKGIKTVIGAAGNVDDVVKASLAESLEVGESACDHGHGHEHHGECGDGHGETHRHGGCGGSN